MSILNGIKLKGDETIHQLDYEQGVGNKPTLVKSWDDLEDKPFYAEQGEIIELLTSQELTFEVADGDEGGIHTLSEPIELIVGDTYIVVWDGISYTCICKMIDDGYGGTITGIGNDNMFGNADDGVPFGIMIQSASGESYYAIFSTDTQTTHTVHVYQENEVVHKLDSKYVDGYTKEEIDTMFGTYVTEVDALLGGE